MSESLPDQRKRLIDTVADIGIVKVVGGLVETLDPIDYSRVERAAAPSAEVLIYKRDDGGWIAEHRAYGKIGGRGSEQLVQELRAWSVVK